MNTLNKLIESLSIPIMFLNIFGGIAAGIWLAIIREWRLIGIGIGLMFFATFFLSFLLMPGLLLSPIAMSLKKRNNPLFYVVGFLSQLYTNIIIVVSCGVAFLICVRFYEGESKVELIPYVLWSWGMALGPWQSMASSEQDNEYTLISLFSASVCYMLFLASIFVGSIFPLVAIGLFLLVQLLLLPFFNLWIANKQEEMKF